MGVLLQQPQPAAPESSLFSSSEHEIILLPGPMALEILPLLREFISPALEYAHRETDVEHLAPHILEGNIQLWAAYNKERETTVGAACTMLQQYDKCRGLRILTLAGNEFPLWKELMLARLIDFAKINRATRIEASGRRGWARILQPLGFEQAYVTFVKEI